MISLTDLSLRFIIFNPLSSKNVVVISSDGQRHRQLLSNKDGLVSPVVLDYDRSTNNLLVVNERDTAFLFDVTRLQ
jgi:hypothetical protein